METQKKLRGHKLEKQHYYCQRCKVDYFHDRNLKICPVCGKQALYNMSKGELPKIIKQSKNRGKQKKLDID